MTESLPKQIRKSEEVTIKWLALVQDRLGYEDPEESFVAFRAVLHTLRDRLTVDEAADLAAQMPLLIKGVYYDGWKPANTPLKIRQREEFLELVQSGMRDYMNPEEVVRGVFDVIKRLISEGEISDIKNDLPGELQGYFE